MKKIYWLLMDTMGDVLSFNLKLILLIKVKSYYVIALMHVTMKLENNVCKVIVTILKKKEWKWENDKMFTKNLHACPSTNWEWKAFV